MPYAVIPVSMQTHNGEHLNGYRVVNVRVHVTSSQNMYSKTMSSPNTSRMVEWTKMVVLELN